MNLKTLLRAGSATAVAAALAIAALAIVEADFARPLLWGTLFVAGATRSLQFTALNTLAFADIVSADRATSATLSSVTQQIALLLGVALSVAMIRVSETARGAEATELVDAARLPWLLFLQGGPGGRGVRTTQLSGWMKAAARDFRILMLDQRGTGLSTDLSSFEVTLGAEEARLLCCASGEAEMWRLADVEVAPGVAGAVAAAGAQPAPDARTTRMIADLGLREVRVQAREVSAYLGGDASEHDLVFLDPPYDLGDDVIEAVLDSLTGGWLADRALVVVERSARSPEPSWPAVLAPEWDRTYGDTAIWVARRVHTT